MPNLDDEYGRIFSPNLRHLRPLVGADNAIFPGQNLLLRDASNFLWTISVNDDGVLTRTKGAIGSAVPAVYLNDFRTDTTTWQLGITTDGNITTTSLTFDDSKPRELTLISAHNFVWYLHLNSIGVLQTSASQNWNQLRYMGAFVDKLIAIRTASHDLQNAPGPVTTWITGAAYWNANPFGPDQLAQVRVSALSNPAGGVLAQGGPCVRMSDNGNFYVAIFQRQSTGVTTLYLYKFFNGGTSTATTAQLGQVPLSGAAIGDIIGVGAQGTTITAYYNGVPVIQVTDTSLSSGQPGIYCFYSATGDSPVRFDNWNAGQYGGTTGELVSFQDATLTATYKYTLGTRFRRGVAGTPISAHASGSQFLRLDDNVFSYEYDPSQIGQLLFFKFPSFNLRGSMLEDLDKVPAYPFQITGSSLGLLTPAHATYRPVNPTNPLRATDTGASTTIIVDTFSMRIPGVPDIPISSGFVNGVTYGTLQNVYYDDPAFMGGNVVFQATTDKETALRGAGRFFVGSIFVPIFGAPDTVGNNDGGSGAQLGTTLSIFAQSYLSSTGGDGTLVSPQDALDSNLTTYAEISASGGFGDKEVFTVQTFNIPIGPWKSLTLYVLTEVPANTYTGNANCECSASIDNGNSFTHTFFTTQSTRAKQIDSVALDLRQNNTQIQVFLSTRGAIAGTGAATARMYGAWVVGVQ